MKQVSGSLKLELAQYRELQAFAQFGSDLDPATKATLDHGERLVELLKQAQYSPLTVSEQVLSLFAAKYKFLRDIEVKDIADYEKKMHAYMHEQHADIIAELDEKEAFLQNWRRRSNCVGSIQRRIRFFEGLVLWLVS